MKLESSFHKSPKNAYSYHWIKSGLFFILEILILISIYILYNYFSWYHFIIYILIFLFVLSFLRCIIQPYINFNHKYYRVGKNNIEVKSTFIFKKHQITKIERLQYLQLKTNPILKRLHLNIVIFVTAGHEVRLPLLSVNEADKLANEIFIELRGADSDV